MAMNNKYLDLIRSFPLRPIRSDSDLTKAEKVMHELVDASRLTEPEADYLLILHSRAGDHFSEMTGKGPAEIA